MPGEPPDSPVTEAVRSLEVRWILAGQLQTAVAGWFGRFPARTEAREDTYLLDPQLPGLSVKVRGGGALEVKAYRGSPGILEVAGRARGRLESWQKWSFPVSPLSPGRGDPAGWRPGRKRRRISRFSLASGQMVAPLAAGLGQEPRCEVELTEVRTGGQDWWTLGFEATGPADLLRGALKAAAAVVFAQALPGGVEPGRMNPDPTRSGWASSRAPAATTALEGRPSAGPDWSAQPLPRPARRVIAVTGDGTSGYGVTTGQSGLGLSDRLASLPSKLASPSILMPSCLAGSEEAGSCGRVRVTVASASFWPWWVVDECAVAEFHPVALILVGEVPVDRELLAPGLRPVDTDGDRVETAGWW